MDGWLLFIRRTDGEPHGRSSFGLWAQQARLACRLAGDQRATSQQPSPSAMSLRLQLTKAPCTSPKHATARAACEISRMHACKRGQRRQKKVGSSKTRRLSKKCNSDYGHIMLDSTAVMTQPGDGGWPSRRNEPEGQRGPSGRAPRAAGSELLLGSLRPRWRREPRPERYTRPWRRPATCLNNQEQQ